MKKAAKVFLVIGMILGFYAILPIIFGVITIKKINNASSAQELKGWGVVSIIFVSVLGGIFTLCIRDSELDNYYPKSPKELSVPKVDESANKLHELKELSDSGVIDEETYQEKRKKYLEDL